MSEPNVDMSSWYPEEREHRACDERAQLLIAAKSQWLSRAVRVEEDLRDLRRDHLALHVRATELARDLGRARDEAASARDEAAAARHWEGEARRQQASETANHGKTWTRLQRARAAYARYLEAHEGLHNPSTTHLWVGEPYRLACAELDAALGGS